MRTSGRICLLLPLLLLACAPPAAEEGTEGGAEEPSVPSAEPPPEGGAAPAALRLLDFDAGRLPAGVAHQGEVVAGARWSDANGENLLLLTQTGAFPSGEKDCEECQDAEIFGYSYLREGEQWRLLWQLVDFERGCPFDLYAAFRPGSLSIADLDEDGVAESTFLYTLACRSDVSPARLKLIMREGTTKYAIRGTTRLPALELGGEMVLDPAFSEAPPALLAFAREQWGRYVVEEEFRRF